MVAISDKLRKWHTIYVLSSLLYKNQITSKWWIQMFQYVPSLGGNRPHCRSRTCVLSRLWLFQIFIRDDGRVLAKSFLGLWPLSWWRHQMETFSALLAICAGNSPFPGKFPAQRSVTRSFDVLFDLRLNKRLSKQSWGWWFETPSRSLWRHRNILLRLLTGD